MKTYQFKNNNSGRKIFVVFGYEADGDCFTSFKDAQAYIGNRGEQPVKTTELGYQLWRNGLNELNYRAYAQTIYPLLSPTHLHLCIRIEKIETPNS